ncbi:SanA protein [Pustulibacterium marinum]|uniref:SanA protein n=2 Tax=Pustulibacterium marinum TaxID=1224947 RepID=A0A1I7IQ39_9FLAO|nr:SanA protein [Pustulibacterium marinum]
MIQIFFILILVLVIIIFSVDFLVNKDTEGSTFSSVERIASQKVGLLLGTSKYIRRGELNKYYENRIDAAVALYKAGKINYILVSGDNGTLEYNEPITMKNDLIERGVQEECIYLDYAGFRTLDSVVRCKEIFGQTEIIVISQKWHNQRAIYIAESKGMKATGFNAKDVSVSYGFKTQMREKLARCKMVLDLMFGKRPKFGGEKIEIE